MKDGWLEELGEFERRRQAEARGEPSRVSREFKARLASRALHALREPPREGRLLRAQRWVPAIAAALAAAAAVMLFWAPRPALPAYELTIRGGERSERSGAPDPSNRVLKLSEGTVLTVALRPEEPVAGKISAVAYLYDGQNLRAWDSSFEISSEGALYGELAVGAAELAATGAKSEVVIAVAAGALPGPARLEKYLRSGHESSSRRIYFFRRTIEAVNPGSATRSTAGIR